MAAKNGFTLVELAIALMVIGLLIGGVLKGQELIENARITNTVRDISGYVAAVRIFENTYEAFPGITENPQQIPGCVDEVCATAGDGGALIPYHHDASIPYYTAQHAPAERRRFWIHLARAGLIDASFDMTTPGLADVKAGPASALKKAYFFVHRYDNATMGDPVQSSNWLKLGAYSNHANPGYGGLTSLQAFQIDEKLDDGKPFSGDIRKMNIFKNTTNNNCVATGEVEYNPVGRGLYCNLAILIPQ